MAPSLNWGVRTRTKVWISVTSAIAVFLMACFFDWLGLGLLLFTRSEVSQMKFAGEPRLNGPSGPRILWIDEFRLSGKLFIDMAYERYRDEIRGPIRIRLANGGLVFASGIAFEGGPDGITKVETL